MGILVSDTEWLLENVEWEENYPCILSGFGGSW